MALNLRAFSRELNAQFSNHSRIESEVSLDALRNALRAMLKEAARLRRAISLVIVFLRWFILSSL
jgi:hypothetical protein